MKPLDGLPFPELETVVFSPFLELPLVRFLLIFAIALILVSFCIPFVCFPRKKTISAFPTPSDPWVRLSWDFSKSGSLKNFYADALLVAKIPAPERSREILFGASPVTERDWEGFQTFYESLQNERRSGRGVE